MEETKLTADQILQNNLFSLQIENLKRREYYPQIIRSMNQFASQQTAELQKRLDEYEDVINRLSDERFAYERANNINTTERDKLWFEFKELHLICGDNGFEFDSDAKFLFDWFYGILNNQTSEKDREIESLRKEIYQLREGKSGAVGLKIYGINKSLESQLSELAKALESAMFANDIEGCDMILKEALAKYQSVNN